MTGHSTPNESQQAQIGQMIAWAFAKHRAGESGSKQNKGESFLEYMIRWILWIPGEPEHFLGALGVKDVKRGSVSYQFQEPHSGAGTPDLTIPYESSNGQKAQTTIEFKIDAALTAYQNTPGYANYLICPSAKVQYYTNLLSTLNSSQKQGRTRKKKRGPTVKGWDDLCALNQHQGPNQHLWQVVVDFANNMLHPMLPLPEAKCLFNNTVASAYEEWLKRAERLAKQRKYGKQLKLYADSAWLQEGCSNNHKHTNAQNLGISFRPEEDTPLFAENFAASNRHWRRLASKDDIKATYYEGTNSKDELLLTKPRQVGRPSHRFPAKDVTGAKNMWGDSSNEWPEDCRNAGMIINAVFRQIWLIAKDPNLKVKVETVPLSNCIYGLRLTNGTNDVCVVVNAGKWAEGAATDSPTGPFYVNGEPVTGACCGSGEEYVAAVVTATTKKL